VPRGPGPVRRYGGGGGLANGLMVPEPPQNARMDVKAPARTATVLVAVRSPQMREALSALIGSFIGFRVVGEAATHEQAIQIARSDRPRVAIVDEDASSIHAMHDEGVVEAIVAIGARADGARRAQAAGARGYLQIGASPADILDALNTALSS
jgi:DNA-binding NarL/FixJ family response regulator